MKNSTVRRTNVAKVGLALAAAGALAFGGISPAYAADLTLGPGDVAGFENGDETQVGAGYNYDQWHVGSNYDPEFALEQSVQFGECSVTALAQTSSEPGVSVVQLLKGFPIDARPTAGLPAYGGDGTLAPIEGLVNSTSIEVLQGSVTLQIPVFVFDGLDDEPRSPESFSTVRSVALEPGTYNLADLALTDSSGWTSFLGTSWSEIYTNLQADVDDDYYFQILGVGFTGSEGAEVSTVSFGGDTYYFGSGDCAPAPEPQPEPQPQPGPTAPKPPVAVQTAAE
ncbi:hypothetical protein [Leucobacter sp. gxy201]|uniref:hypothetical protein n=1 Tax=Leucobacter sp. gxy201 TaxID=2957200 RepID=UPI003DA113B9